MRQNGTLLALGAAAGLAIAGAIRGRSGSGARAGRYDALVEKWAREKLSKTILRRIDQAKHDLYYGSSTSGEGIAARGRGVRYPGFTTACNEIRDAFDDLPSTVYVDTQAEYVLESKPEGWRDDDGTWNEPSWEDYVEYDRRGIKRAVLGELAGYL